MDKVPSNNLMSRKEYLDDPKHPLRLKPSVKRKPKKVDRIKLEVEKSNENFSLIEKMREEIQNIVGPEIMQIPSNNNSTRQAFTPMSPLEDSLSRQGKGSLGATSPPQLNSPPHTLSYSRTNKPIEENDDQTMNTEISALTPTLQNDSQLGFFNSPNQQQHHHNFLATMGPSGANNQPTQDPSKKRQRPRSKGRESENAKSSQLFENTNIPILPAFFEIETFRREQSQANDQLEAEKQRLQKSKSRRQNNENGQESRKPKLGDKEDLGRVIFEKGEDDDASVVQFNTMQRSSKPISAIPVIIPEGGSSGPGFYGVSFKRNPSRVPQSAIDFWSNHKDQAPTISSKGLGALSFDLPYQSEIQTTITNHTKDKNFYRYSPSSSAASLTSPASTMSQIVSLVVQEKEAAAASSHQRASTATFVADRTSQVEDKNSSTLRASTATALSNTTVDAANFPVRTSRVDGQSRINTTNSAMSEVSDDDELTSFVISLGSNPTTPISASYHLNTGEMMSQRSSRSKRGDGFRRQPSSDSLLTFRNEFEEGPLIIKEEDEDHVFKNTTNPDRKGRAVVQQGLEESHNLWEDQFRSPLARSLAPSMLYLTHNATNTAHIEVKNLSPSEVASPTATASDGGGSLMKQASSHTSYSEHNQTKEVTAREISADSQARSDEDVRSASASRVGSAVSSSRVSARIPSPTKLATSSSSRQSFKPNISGVDIDSDSDASESDLSRNKNGYIETACEESSAYEDKIGEDLARAMLQSEAAVVGGPDFDQVLLVAASYRNKSPRTELAEIDLARQAIKKGKLAHMGITNEYQVSCQLFAWSAEAHQAAWVIQRFVRKRQIRRAICQVVIRNAYFSYVERREYFKAVQNAKKLSGQLMPILRIYMLKIKKKVRAQRKAAVFLQSNIRKWKAVKRAELLREQRYLNAAMLLTQTFRARLRYRKRKKRRDKVQLVMALKLQAWIRGRIARKEFRMMELCQRWFASTWRKFFEKKYGSAVYRIQQLGRRFILGLKARKIQGMGRIWLAKRRAKEKVIEATIAENIRYKGEHTYVSKGVKHAIDGLAATYDGTGAMNGVSDKETGKEAKKKLDQTIRIREKTIQSRHKAAIHMNEVEFKTSIKKLKADGVLPDNKAKLRKEIRSLLYLSHQPLLSTKSSTDKKGKKASTNSSAAKAARKKLNKDNNQVDEDDVINFDEKSNFGSLFCFYDGPMRSRPPPLSTTKKYNETQLSRRKRQNKFYEESVLNMQRALTGQGYRKKVGCSDIHFLRILVASFGCYDVSEEELLFIMHEFDPTTKELPASMKSGPTQTNESKQKNEVQTSSVVASPKQIEATKKGGGNLAVISEGLIAEGSGGEDVEGGEDKDEEKGKRKTGFFSGLNNIFSKKKTVDEGQKSREELFPVPFRSNVNPRGYVANDERLILGLSLLITRHLYGENRLKGVSGSAVGVGRQLQAAWGKVGRSVPVFEGSIGSMVSKTLLPQSMLYVHAAKYEHLRTVADMAFVKSTEHYRIRYPAKWSCPLCLAAFPTWGMMNRHVRCKNCVRRAPTFSRDNESSVEMWELITEKRVSREKVNYFAKMKSFSGAGTTQNINSTDKSQALQSKQSFSSKTVSKSDSQQISEASSELSATTAAQVAEAEAANLGGYWDPSGGLNKRGRHYASGIPPPEEQVLEM